eukprot:392082-Heterocapsa_arctica.AAC.1
MTYSRRWTSQFCIATVTRPSDFTLAGWMMPVRSACRFWGVLASYSLQSRHHTSRPLPSQPSLM